MIVWETLVYWTCVRISIVTLTVDNARWSQQDLAYREIKGAPTAKVLADMRLKVTIPVLRVAAVQSGCTVLIRLITFHLVLSNNMSFTDAVPTVRS